MLEVKQAVKRLMAGAMALSLTGMCTVSAFAVNESDPVLESVFGTSDCEKITQDVVLDVLDVDPDDTIEKEPETVEEPELIGPEEEEPNGGEELDEASPELPEAESGAADTIQEAALSSAETEEGTELPEPPENTGWCAAEQDCFTYRYQEGNITVTAADGYYSLPQQDVEDQDEIWHFSAGIYYFDADGIWRQDKDLESEQAVYEVTDVLDASIQDLYLEPAPPAVEVISSGERSVVSNTLLASGKVGALYYYQGQPYTGLYRYKAGDNIRVYTITNGELGGYFSGKMTSGYQYICAFQADEVDNRYYYDGIPYTGLYRYTAGDTITVFRMSKGEVAGTFSGKMTSGYKYICAFQTAAVDNRYYYNGQLYTGLYRYTKGAKLYYIENGGAAVLFTGFMTGGYTYICDFTAEGVDNGYYLNGVKATVKKPATLSYSSSYKSGKYYKALMALKLIGTARSNIVEIALSQLGYHEGKSTSQLGGNGTGSGNYTEYGRYYGLTYGAWCAMFVSWCAREDGVSTSVIPKYAAVRDYYTFYHRSGQKFYSWKTVRTMGYQPQVGDLIMYANTQGGTAHHIGYVISSSYSSSKVVLTTVEGNTSDQVRKVVMNMSRSSSSGYVNSHYILGVAHPNY